MCRGYKRSAHVNMYMCVCVCALPIVHPVKVGFIKGVRIDPKEGREGRPHTHTHTDHQGRLLLVERFGGDSREGTSVIKVCVYIYMCKYMHVKMSV
jgi:hypothetical protein